MKSPRRVLRVLFLAVCCWLQAGDARAALAPEEARVVAWLARQEEEMVALLERAVKIDSTTENVAGVRATADVFAAELKPLGFTPRWVALPETTRRAGHLFAERSGAHGKRVLLIGHLDTVLPGGSFAREEDAVVGSGTNDMKGGNVVLVYALKALQAAGVLDGTQIVVALTGDEESLADPVEVSRRELIAAGKRSDVALAFETARVGEVTVARRGSSAWRLEVQGPAGHSSAIFTGLMGSGAVYEAARILDGFHTELRKLPGLTASVALIGGGAELKEDGWNVRAEGKHNLIPGRVVARGDLRTGSAEQLAQADAAMREVVSKHGLRTHATLEITPRYPPMAAEPRHLQLLAMYDAVSRELGQGPVVANDPVQRGAGDSAFVAPHCAVIDGLGAFGGGAHTERETADVKSLVSQAQRAAVLLYRLTR